MAQMVSVWIQGLYEILTDLVNYYYLVHSEVKKKKKVDRPMTIIHAQLEGA